MFVRRLTKVLLYFAIVAAVVIGVLRATVIRWWRIPDDDPYLEASIAPTLAGGDLIVLWRLSPPRFGDLALRPEPKADGRVVLPYASPGGRQAAPHGRPDQEEGGTLASSLLIGFDDEHDPGQHA